ncbi:MAG: ornithine cyclodeaminase family protein [Ideonella sp. WA131b]|nr:ornithine cyclodeaminase family protein [Ideonella sp. WA131b]
MTALRLFDGAAVASATPFAALVAALRTAFAEGVEVPARHVHTWPDGDGGSLTSLLMPAWTRPGPQGSGFYGVKIINVAPGNAARGLPGLHGSYTLFDAATGRPLALLDADALTARRTVAASALAAGYLARPDASRLLVVGAGRLAALLPAAHRAVRPIRQVRVWARRPEAAAALVARWQTEGFDAEAATDLQAALGAADIVSCATLATEPLVQGAWLAPGAHLDLIGGFTPAMREADDDCFRGARLAIDTEEALTKAGDLLGPVSRGVFTAADVRATLAQLCRGSVPGRTQERQRTVFKSVGTALEDLAAARLVWRTLGPAPAA